MKIKKILFVYLFLFFSVMIGFNAYAEGAQSLAVIESILSLSENAQNNQIKVEYSALTTEGEIIVALYNQTALVEVNTASVSVGQTQSILSFDTSSLSSATSVRAFIWSSLNNLTAISDIKVASFPLDNENIGAGTVTFNYKRNEDGEQLFLYKFGTSGDDVEISICENSDYTMSDLTLTAVPQNGNIVSEGEIMTIVSTTDYTANVRFTGNYLGKISINSYITGTDIIQDSIQIEILDDYSNIATSSNLGGVEDDFCLVPTVENNGIFTSAFSLAENKTAFGNDCTVDISTNTSVSNTDTSHISLQKNSTLENIRVVAPYVDRIFDENEVSESEHYKLMSTVSLSDNAKIKNAYIKHGAYVVDILGDNVTLEDITISCGVVPVNLKDSNSLELNGNIIIDNNTKTDTCSTHTKGCGIAVFNSEASTYVNINGNLWVYGFINIDEATDFPVSLPTTSEDIIFTFLSEAQYINPIIVLEGTGNLIVNVSEQSNLYNIASTSDFTSGRIFTYSYNAVNSNDVDLSYLMDKPTEYTSNAGYKTVRYTSSGLTDNIDVYVNGETAVDFSNIKFEKYKDELDYDVTAFRAYVEEENTTVYEYMENCFDDVQKEFTIPDEIPLPAQIYVIFNVNDIYDNEVYSDCTTFLNCLEDNISPTIIFTQPEGAGHGTQNSRTVWPCGKYYWSGDVYCYKLDTMYGLECYASDGSTDNLTITTSWVSQNGGPIDSAVEKIENIYKAASYNYNRSTSKGHIFRYRVTGNNGYTTNALRYYTFPNVTECEDVNTSPQPESLGNNKIGYEKAKEFIANGQLSGTYNGLNYYIIPGTAPSTATNDELYNLRENQNENKR